MKIVVLSGGRSTERNVSLSSGVKITNALRSKGYEVAYVDSFLGKDVDEDKIDDLFTTEPENESKLVIDDEVLTDEKINALRTDGTRGLLGRNVLKICQHADIVYMGLHGEDGENGKMQAVFDVFDIRYTGSGSLASGLAMDKKYSKEIFVQDKIPTAKYTTTKTAKILSEDIPFNYPMVVKPSNGGSSVGTHIVENATELRESVADALQFDSEVLIEEYIKGREFSVAIVDGLVLPAVEIAVDTGWYDFQHKFQENNVTHFITPPENLDDETHAQMQALTKKTFEALGMSNYGRVDFLLRDGQLYVMEANTLPGMTPLSLMPREAEAVGISYPDLCERIIKSKMKYYEEKL
ncbi:D-alanine--D-alanine ligase [Companilactobacillus zhachilii]|jgi:D-alanine--D-alanine ligase|uniref:D-alanine--D-alanine ligase n=2 Tax=Companilactobacillus TaxID=2767879 RepID=A0A386PSM0_9LACO|nr:D-alanine--D-alanine ligase [Companilactobacillus zhachilii]AYE37380.1 D-alanine--D-alanine ligase [Companilactobacillus zhachilii]MBL3530880.1 D-alanine--D-alanine ligase [Companilactobacillus zhachilii]